MYCTCIGELLSVTEAIQHTGMCTHTHIFDDNCYFPNNVIF